MITTVYLFAALSFLFFCLFWLLRKSSLKDFSMLSGPVDSDMGENFALFLLKMLLYIILIFVFMSREALNYQGFVVLMMVTLYALIMYVSGYRYQ
ncbi:TPA: hypothetical protein DCG86_08695 [Candidatus Marinimicrobia bacterium]|nr:MAG: hypothetical protein XD77_0736 [Marinimicrobia bacterium 46_47]KUK93211.1 MAG: hypothetical protein XE04_0325 [Marinimicrobia bacterium 46_43]HAE88085.1 hypothetical protein [Candidatus Neomarinimicrobiota bacterium]HBY18435.1 hypothetical protein [Candidatus Neomarinimicrobiota bacterium]